MGVAPFESVAALARVPRHRAARSVSLRRCCQSVSWRCASSSPFAIPLSPCAADDPCAGVHRTQIFLSAFARCANSLNTSAVAAGTAAAVASSPTEAPLPPASADDRLRWRMTHFRRYVRQRTEYLPGTGDNYRNDHENAH